MLVRAVILSFALNLALGVETGGEGVLVEDVRLSGHGSLVAHDGVTLEEEGVSRDLVTSVDFDNVPYNKSGGVDFYSLAVSDGVGMLAGFGDSVKVGELFLLLGVLDGLHSCGEEHRYENGESFDPGWGLNL